jgi:hypothetical protein
MLRATISKINVDSIEIDYTLTNDRRQAIYVFDVLYRTDRSGNRIIDHSLAYVMLDNEGGVVIGKFLAEIPRGMKVESPEIPYLVKLAPGQTVHRRIRIPLPAETYDPYSDQAVAINVAQIQRAQLRIGIIDSLAFADDEAVIDPADEVRRGLFICDYGLGLRYQEIWEIAIE